MKRALVCGAGGFIGGHLVKKLKRKEGIACTYAWIGHQVLREHQEALLARPAQRPAQVIRHGAQAQKGANPAVVAACCSTCEGECLLRRSLHVNIDLEVSP